jgi:hypothetical protein
LVNPGGDFGLYRFQDPTVVKLIVTDSAVALSLACKSRRPTPEQTNAKMKQKVSDWLLAPKPELDVQKSPTSPVFTGIHPERNLLSDEGKLLLLTHLYLELRLTLEHALRAAQADIMAAKAQSHRLWVEQHCESNQ